MNTNQKRSERAYVREDLAKLWRTNVRAILETLGVRQIDLASKLGVTRQSLSTMDNETLYNLSSIATSAVILTALISAPAISRAVNTHKYKKEWSSHRDDNAEALKKDREKEEIDPETGLYLKKKDKGIEDDLTKINPNLEKGQPFYTNCTMCTAAMEMRRRGYDVAACGLVDNDQGGLTAKEYSKWFKPPTKHTEYNLLTSDSSTKMKKEVAAQGNGARGEICARWALGGGHSMFYQVEKGKMVVYDAQAGKKYSEKEFNDILDSSVQVRIRRLDTLEPNMDAMNKKKNKPLC